MRTYILKRIAAGIAMLFALSVFIFILLNLAPGDPIYAYVNPSAAITQADLDALRHRIGLDRPLPVQYVTWLGNMLRGEMGYSIKNNFMPIRSLIAERIGPTVLLMGVSMILAIILGMATGIYAAVRKGKAIDYFLAVLAFLGLSSPAFLTSLIGLFLFSVYWRVAPSGGMLTPGAAFSVRDVLAHLWLPAVILAVAQAALIMRYMRSSMLESLTQDYVRTARAKGVTEFWVVAKHALRNSLLPVITLVGANLGAAVGGAIFVESVFGWPGMGLLLISSVEARDYPTIMAIAMIIGVCVLVANLLTDIAYAIADPRIKLGGRA